MIARIDVSSPPGVSMVIRISWACSLFALAMPLVMYSARTGSISPDMRSSTTLDDEEELAASGPAACVIPRTSGIADSPATTSASSQTRRRDDRRDGEVFTEKHYSRIKCQRCLRFLRAKGRTQPREPTPQSAAQSRTVWPVMPKGAGVRTTSCTSGLPITRLKAASVSAACMCLYPVSRASFR